MNPETILKNVQQTYSGFQSYADEGTVDLVPPIGQTSLEFKTYFAQPAKFRFDWRSWFPHQGKDQTANESSIWTDGKTAHQIVFGQISHPGFLHAIAGATGVSSASVLMILKLLIPDCIECSGTWYQMHNANLLADEEINGVACYHLVGSTLKTSDKEAWIGKDDYLVRRLLSRTDITEEDGEQLYKMAVESLKTLSASMPRVRPCHKFRCRLRKCLVRENIIINTIMIA